ncbi:MAG TPA: VanZ family protein [Bacteroidales bacterium]|jgi:glycopeptide antibiotics resistance protein|nr:VanZ family protein [Bacteroidales bacterium]MDI9573221.1 VanZ family protein [Bacteroidota bacterium]OQC59091.1 MAG: VanZ like family protein [Bacteroidetes bacterium ADurb.Bin012]HNQ60515.1 VanZ family protein [Bacteroidales bacterium]HNU22184.1 VanZ family protein [Bacteroidales bacterium]
MMRKLIFFIYLGLITTLSLIPSSDLPSVKLFSGADKIIHFLMYTGFTFLLMWAWPNFFRGSLLLLPLFAVMFYGLGLEILQDLGHEGRAFEIYDILANTLGYFPGLALFYIVRKYENH